MQIAQAVFGVFHHFDLARELNRRGHLNKIYSTYPWARLKREGLDRSKVDTFPYTHLAQYAIDRYFPSLSRISDELGYPTALLFDEWLDRRVPNSGIDALIAISGAGLKTGKHLQERGGTFICDRGSTHLSRGDELHAAEFKRWGLEYKFDIRDTVREEAIYEVADAITVPSNFAARTFVQSGIPKEKIHVIPYGVQLDKFFPVGEPPLDSFEVLFAGQVSLRKGVPYLLQAFAQLNHPRKRLRVVGGVAASIKPLLGNLPQTNVEFVRNVSQAELARYMSTSHVLVLPSIEEGLALVQAQAMACGCPVLATTNTGSEDLYDDGIEGFIVPIRDIAALRDRMQQLADDPSLQRRMSEAALLRVRLMGGWKQYGDRWESLLKRLTAKSA